MTTPSSVLGLANSISRSDEGNNGVTSFTFEVLRTGDTSDTASATWRVSVNGDHSANAADFADGILPTGVVAFAAGQTSAEISVNVMGDKAFEPDEDFTLTLSNPSGASLDMSTVSKTLDESASGGYGVTENYYKIIGDGGIFKLNYQMYGIPDKADIYVNSTLVASTGDFVSDTGTLTIPDTTPLKFGDLVKVVMTGNDEGTGWDYDVHYNAGTRALNYLGTGIILNDDVNNVPTGTVTIAGNAVKDETLTASNNLDDADGLGVIHYSWLSNSTPVGTGKTYTISADDVGKKLSVIASYTDDLGTAESVSSAKTQVVDFPKLKLRGTAGDDTLTGGEGNDRLAGYLGDDIEEGGAGNDVLYGYLGNNTLNGGVGNDKLISGKGYNLLTGGEGKDSFYFSAPSHGTITDFVVADDRIQLNQDHFSNLSMGQLDAGEFVISAKAQDSNDYLIYNKNTGVLAYDDDGSGSHAAVQIVTLGVNLTLTATDFLVV